MSLFVNFGIDHPYARGMRYGVNPNNPGHHRYVAYRYEGDSLTTWFGGVITGDAESYGNTFKFKMWSGHRARSMPLQRDDQVKAIPAFEYYRLVNLETMFWADYDNYFATTPNPRHRAAIAHCHAQIIARGL